MNPIVLIWSVSKIIEFLGLLLIKGWKVWIVLFAIEGLFSTTMNQSIIRNVVFYDPLQEQLREIEHQVECDLEKEKAAEASQVGAE